MRIDGEKRTDKLGAGKKQDRDIQGSALQADFALPDHFDKPRRGHDYGDSVDHHHLVVLKKFVVPGGEKQGNEAKKQVKSDFYARVAKANKLHGGKYITILRKI